MPRSPAPYAIIVPAHNEAGVIAAALWAIRARDGEPPAEIIIVCNGCTDDTAAIARAAAPDAQVIELDIGSKALALNTGNEAAHAASRLYTDADVQPDRRTLDAVAAVLAEPGVMAASPAVTLDLTGADRFVRAYYRVWANHAYLERGVGGSGVYGLSAAGLAKLGAFPPVIADDGYVRAFFALEEQRRVAHDAAGRPVSVTVRPPRRVGELIRSESRWRAGDAQVRALLGPPRAQETPANGLAGILRSDAAWRDIAVYVGIKLAGRLLQRINRGRGLDQVWHRDRSSRAP